jgi:mannosylglycerate hydrolase
MNEKKNVIIVSHTHWDRAWYVTFQEFRARLVRLVDRLLNILAEQPDYRVFMLDGQMAVLEDYLEIRPQRQAEIESLCRSGRLKVGPWYVLADEFLVSPESLIRNMMLGHKMGENFGGVSKIGYVPDGFGHIAQLPQILNGFGIDNAIFWRGLGTEGERLGTEFEWKAPDGSSVTAIWMPYGYHNISNLGYAIHWGDISQMEFDIDLAVKQIRDAVDALSGMGHTSSLLLMNGIDHEEPEPRLPEIIQIANEKLTDCKIIQGTIAEHLANVRQTKPTLPEFSGEFRWGKYAEILQGVYATRIHLKQRNHQVETLFERYTEPLAAIAWMSGADVPEGTQDLIWKGWHWLLKNHPHDDIYGCGIDPVHEEMEYRFSQAEQIGEIIVRDSLRQIAREVDFTKQEGMPVLVYNPLSWRRKEIAIGDIDFEYTDPRADDFQLIDNQGQIVPTQVLFDEQVFWMETLKANQKRRVRIAFQADVPACGFASYYVQKSTEKPVESNQTSDFRVHADGAENRFMDFRIAHDGGLTITDKFTGARYTDIHHFEDVDDAGDEYSSNPSENSQSIRTNGVPANVKQLVIGPNLATFEVKWTLNIPVGLSPDRKKRSVKTVPFQIISHISLYQNQPGLFIETQIDNQIMDHKLSVNFPTRLEPTQSYVDQAFLVLARDIDLPDSSGWIEDPTHLMHQRAFTSLQNDKHGLAVLNRGLPAVEVTRIPGGTRISLTLLRSVGWLSRDDLSTRRVAAGPLVPTPGAQCIGKYKFEYAVLPHNGNWRSVYQYAYAYTTPLLVARADTHEGLDLSEMNITNDDPAMVKQIEWPREGQIPDKLSFIKVDNPELVISALKRSIDGNNLVVRFFNISPDPIITKLKTYKALEHVWLVDFNENRQEPVKLLDDRTFEAQLRGHQIITFELIFSTP